MLDELTRHLHPGENGFAAWPEERRIRWLLAELRPSAPAAAPVTIPKR